MQPSSRRENGSATRGRRPGGNNFRSRNGSPAGRQFGGRSNGSQQRRSGGGGNRRKGMGAYIDPSKFINKAKTPQQRVEFVPNHAFVDFGFEAGLQQNIAAKGYIHPTPVQDGAIKSIMQGKDLIGLANTGTGKTAAFMLPIINRLLTDDTVKRAIVIAPTRELAVQIDDEFRAFAKGLRLYSALCVGGTNMLRQINAIRRNPQVIVGTPGRLKDLVNRDILKLHETNIIVLDEADRMLDMGFLPDIHFLIGQLPPQRQSLCFSATITPEISRLLDDMLDSPVTVSVRTGETSEHVEQDVIYVESRDHKHQKLDELLRQPDYEKVIIFGQTKWGVQRLAETLSKDGIASEAIHGNKSQAQRQRSLQAFKNGRVNVLVATDVAARGLDIPNVSHVINFDQPATYEDYVHRIGRTGRGGASGSALTFVERR